MRFAIAAVALSFAMSVGLLGPPAQATPPLASVQAGDQPVQRKPVAKPGGVEVPAFHGLRIPTGGKAAGAAPGGGGKIVVYKYETKAADVVAKLRKLLAADGWKVTKDSTSPRGSVRLEVERKGHPVKISVSGSGAQAAIILTRK